MANDVFYGADTEFRIGLMADKDTMPTAWRILEFNRLAVTVIRDLKRRPRIGASRANKLDPLKARLGIERFKLDLVVDGDLVMVPGYLRSFLGAPATTGAGPYTHVWDSGAKTEIYCSIAVRVGTDKIHVFKGVSLASISCAWTGDMAQDLDLQFALQAIERERADAWPTGTTTAVPTPVPVLRGAMLFDGTAADQVVRAGFTWDRNLQDDAYAITTAAGHRKVSYLRPGENPTHSGEAVVRNFGTTYDALGDGASNDTTDFSAEHRFYGLTAAHMLKLANPQAQMTQPPLEIGEGVIERSLGWAGHQSATVPASRITVINTVAAYTT